MNKKAAVLHASRVFKAGNSLAVRIPNALAKHCALEEGSAVEIRAEDGAIVVHRAQSSELHDLIDRMSPENLHEPMVEGLAGKERW